MAQASTYELEDRILASLKKRGGVATAGDVATDTGLNYHEVEIALRRMLSLYKSHLDVDDDGNLRYRFDPSFVRRGDEKGRLWHDIKKAAWTGFQWFFKVWIMVTLVGYTLIFVLILVALAVAAIAASVSSDSDSDGLIELPLYLLARFLEVFFWISLFDDGPSRRHRRSRWALRHRPGKPKPEKAVYQKVFDYVFGPVRKTDPLRAQMAFTQFVREMNGRVTAADWAARTGQSLDEAENALTAAIVRFNGDVDVTNDGQLVYRFDDLLLTAGAAGGVARGPARVWQTRKKAPPFTGNESGTNVWITLFNLFNLGMSFLFLTGSFDALAQGFAVDPGIMYGLGVIPFVFSLIFFAVPGLRHLTQWGAEKKAERENERRGEIRKIYASVEGAQAGAVQLRPEHEKELAVAFQGEPRVDQRGTTYYFFEELKAQLDAGEQARQAARGEVVFGQTVFSSDEDEKSMAQAELDDFDARLARELEGSHVDFDVAVSEAVAVH